MSRVVKEMVRLVVGLSAMFVAALLCSAFIIGLSLIGTHYELSGPETAWALFAAVVVLVGAYHIGKELLP